MIISHRHKFIFIKTKKTGGSSIEYALSAVCGDEDVITPASSDEEPIREGRGAQNYMLPFGKRGLINPIRAFFTDTPERYAGFYNHMPARNVRPLVGERLWREYYTFAFERNPWDRQVSLYYWRYRDPETRPPFRDFILNPRFSRKARNWSIYSINDEVAVDHIARYEALDEELSRFSERVGCGPLPELPRLKSTTRDPSTGYRAHYDDETREAVAGWYRKEIETFGYAF